MDTEQLVGVIRHLAAQREALQYLDEALTKALESSKEVAAAQAKVKAAEETLAKLKVESEDKLAHAQARLAGVEAGIAKRKAEHVEELAKLDKAAKDEREKTLEEVNAAMAKLESVVDQTQLAREQLAAVQEAKAEAQRELSEVKLALEGLRRSILGV